MARKRKPGDEPHDVLAADEFPAPAGADADTPASRAHRLPPDPAGSESAHDILAADEYPPPAHADADTPGVRAHHLPPDPSGLTEPHDILAAEEYPPPAHADVTMHEPPRESALPRFALLAAAALLGYAVVRSRTRSR